MLVLPSALLACAPACPPERRRAPPAAQGAGRRSARRVVGAVAALLGVAAAGACAPAVRVAPDDQAQLADGARLADSLAAAPRWDDASVIALGYLERLRLGLGSPFRLAEQAAGDPRLSGGLGRRTAWALLAATYRGQAFAIDSAALGSDLGTVFPGAVADGGWHRTLIDSAVSTAPSARTGEEAVRIAYTLARAEGLVNARVVPAAIHAAALARDRRLAGDDVRRLLDVSRSARRGGTPLDALELAREWRVARRFYSEAPLLADALAPDPGEAIRIAEGMVVRMRREGVAAGMRPAAPDTATVAGAPVPTDTSQRVAGDSVRRGADSARRVLVVAPAATVSIGPTPAARRDDPALGALPVEAARRLAALPSARGAFPSAPVVVTLGGFRHTVVADTLPGVDSTAELRRARARLVARARTEELLAAEWAAMRGTLPVGGAAAGAARRELAALVQAAAVAVRPWAQAPAVGVAVGTPTNRPGAAAEVDAVRARDGFRSVEFDVDLSPVWRAAAARQLGDAVADLRGVFSALTLDGLRVRVGESPRHDLALALHEPATRTVYLPPATGAGTVAHELVHDLDWQAARAPRLAAGTPDAPGPAGGYRTDRLARAGAGELAQAVRGLGGMRAGLGRVVSAAASGAAPADLDRPAERLARAADFYVAAVLARSGRANGVLSSVQDRVLTGYAGVTAPEPGDGAARALVDVLDAMPGAKPGEGPSAAAVGRAWYLARFGDGGVRSPLGVAGFALGALPAWDAERVLRVAGVPGGLATEAAPGVASAMGACGIGGGAPAAWQPRLLWLAADARARGFVRARAAHAAAAGSPFWGWTARGALGGPWQPEPAESSVARVRDAVLRAALGEARRAAGLCALAPGLAPGARTR